MTLIPFLLLTFFSPHIEYVEIPTTRVEYVNESLDEFEMLTMAIALTESRFNPDAIGSADDAGILQIRPIYVAEVNRVSCSNYSHEDAFDITKSLEMFKALQQAKNPQKDIEKAISLHNRAPWYRKKVLENLEVIRKYEMIRTELVK